MTQDDPRVARYKAVTSLISTITLLALLWGIGGFVLVVLR